MPLSLFQSALKGSRDNGRSIFDARVELNYVHISCVLPFFESKIFSVSDITFDSWDYLDRVAASFLQIFLIFLLVLSTLREKVT